MTEDGNFFPQPLKFPLVSKADLEVLSFRQGGRLDLEVYHIAYKTKKLRACTYRRMLKRQQKTNEKRQKKHVPQSPEQIQVKGNKRAWLQRIQNIVRTEKLQIDPRPQRRGRRIMKRNIGTRARPMQPNMQSMMGIRPHMMGSNMMPPNMMNMPPATMRSMQLTMLGIQPTMLGLQPPKSINAQFVPRKNEKINGIDDATIFPSLLK